MARFCVEILATGSQCTQFARKGQPWCRAHTDPRLRERNVETREFIAWLAQQDLRGIANGLGKIAYELRLKLVTPLHAEAVLDAALARLDQLTEEFDQLTQEQVGAHPVPKACPGNELQTVGVK
jgi:hypothetical protein